MTPAMFFITREYIQSLRMYSPRCSAAEQDPGLPPGLLYCPYRLLFSAFWASVSSHSLRMMALPG